jgi:ribonucleoside-diphosphate reductase alpha chain
MILRDKLNTHIENKPSITDQANVILSHRYLLKNSENKVIETPEELFKRVAKAVASIDTTYGKLPVDAELTAKDFYLMMSNLEFIPNSPTLMNAGTEQGTLSACFVLPLEDSMEGIMKSSTDAAMVQKFGGGTGFSLSKLRPKGSAIKTTHGVACGPIEVLKTLSRVSSMITQGGKRDGANMAVMSVYHPDILEFIECKKVEGDIHNFNISVGVDSNFMNAVKHDMNYSLVNPKDNSIEKHINAREVFNKIVEGAWRNGEPGMIFLDQVNKDNHVKKEYGEMIATNPCGEQPLLPNESCNLGSINLAKFYQKAAGPTHGWKEKIDWSHLEWVTRTSVHFLDNVIDANKYATPEIEEMTKATRKIGLGIMGFADLLIQMQVSYASELAREVGKEMMSKVREWADDESKQLAKVRGTFPAWNDSNYDKETEAYRNHCRLTVAPTGTISMIADTSSGIEPTFALAWKKQNILEGKTLNYINKYFEADAIKHGFYSEDLMDYLAEGGSLETVPNVPDWAKEVYSTAPEISPKDHVLMQAAFQESCDSGISKTINFPNEATIEDVEDTYMIAWENGCKGITVYRAGSREKEVLVKGNKESSEQKTLDGFELEEQMIESNHDCEGGCNIVFESGCETCKTCGWSACKIA